MEGPAGSDPFVARPDPDGDRLGALYAEAKDAIAYSANQVRALTELYREAHRIELRRWQDDRQVLERMDREAGPGATRHDPAGRGPAGEEAGAAAAEVAAASAEIAAAAAVRHQLRRSVDAVGAAAGERERDLARLEVVARGLENAWRFLDGAGAPSLDADPLPADAAELEMRILEAREQERTRLAQEIHDGPAQTIANAFFEVDYVERLMDRDTRMARTEIRHLREVMRRELSEVRGFIAQLRPAALDAAGLDGAIRQAVASFTAGTGTRAETSLEGDADRLTDMQRMVVLRVLQEALQNTRRHADARTVAIESSDAGGAWTLEVRDDGRGFDSDAVGASERPNFGLQFMRERAELVGGTVIVRSRPGAGTTVRLVIDGEGKRG
jgi:two-component system sensor histidine kinase DegS